MQLKLFATEKEGKAKLRVHFRISLLAAVLLALALPSLSLAGKIVVIGAPDEKESGCPAGTQCEPASSSSGQEQSTDSKDNAPKEPNIFGSYVQGNYFEAGSKTSKISRISKPAAASADSTNSTNSAEKKDESGDQASDDDSGSGSGDSGYTMLFSIMEATISGNYAKNFVHASKTSGGNSILLSESLLPTYLENSYAAAAGSVAPRQGDAAGTGGARGAAGGAAMGGAAWPSSASPTYDFTFNYTASDPIQGSGSSDSLVRAQGRGRISAPVRGSSAGAGATDYGSSPYAGGASAADFTPQYGGSTPRNESSRSTSLSMDRELELGTLDLKDFFDIKRVQEGENTSGFMSILMWVGILQALVLGVIVIRILIERGR